MSDKPTDRRHQAFEAYAALGAKRTYRAVADQFGVSLSAVKSWAKAGRWNQRLVEREAREARLLADRSLQEGASESERNLKIVRMALTKLAKDIHEGRVKGALADVDRLVRLEEHLTGASDALCRDPKHADLSTPSDTEKSLEQVKEELLAWCIDITVLLPDVQTRLLEALEEYRHNPDQAEALRRSAPEYERAKACPPLPPRDHPIPYDTLMRLIEP